MEQAQINELKSLMDTSKFKAWLEQQPADMDYPYGNDPACAITQYVRANGFPEITASAYAFQDYEGFNIRGEDGHVILIPNDWDRAALDIPRTFGSLLERVTALLSREAAAAQQPC
jgi:hypothetical protein